MGQVLAMFAAWMGLDVPTTINLLAALGTLLAVFVSVATAIAAGVTVRRANRRLRSYEETQETEDRQRRANERALELAFSEAGAAFVRFTATWLETPANRYWSFSWRVSGRAEMRLLSAQTDAPYVVSVHDDSGVDLLARREPKGPQFLSPRVSDSGEIGVEASGQAQCYVAGRPDLAEPPRVSMTFRDRQRNEWRLDADGVLTLEVSRVIQAAALDE